MEGIDGFAVYCEKSHVLFAFYVPLFVEETDRLAAIQVLLDLS